MPPLENKQESTMSKTEPLDPNVEAPPEMVQIFAPDTLEEGYKFEAEIGGNPNQTFTVEVPPGGVKKGQVFLVPLPDTYDGPRLHAPTGRWKDGLFDFCSLGPLHPHFCCALWCTQIAMAQVMTRLRFTWLGSPGPDVATRNTFRVIVVLVVAYTVYTTALELAEKHYPANMVPPAIPVIKTIGSVLFTLWSIYALCKTRENIRAKYSIPEQRCGGCEDLCCSVFCGCCAVAQMARHTGEYETYQGKWFTPNGLPQGTPMAV